MAALDDEFTVIAAEELIIDLGEPTANSFITRPVGGEAEAAFATKLLGSNGAPGANGASGTHVISHRGEDGKPGQDGFTGGPGHNIQLPELFCFFQKVTLGINTPKNRDVLTFYLDGINGGQGGRGGNGGGGGHGFYGPMAENGYFSCRRGGGDGGTGGMGGRGGQGGPGINGGGGGSLAIYSPIVDVMKFFAVMQEGGAPGDSGPPGTSGIGGAGGIGGQGSTFCGGGNDGHSRTEERPPTLGYGQPGTLMGNRGVKRNMVRDNSDLFS